MLRMGDGGTGEGTLIFRGWQHKFEVKNMILGGIGPGTVELKGDVWNLETVEDFAGTYHPVEDAYGYHNNNHLHEQPTVFYALVLVAMTVLNLLRL